MHLKKRIALFIMALASQAVISQPFSHADTLRGSLGPGRLKWDLLKYDLSIEPDLSNKALKGKNTIVFWDSGVKLMQVDLQMPMQIDSVKHHGNMLAFAKDGPNAWFIVRRDTNALYKIKPGIDSLEVFFSGHPKIARNPPWDGGWIFTEDSQGRPWATVACQGLGASVWFPCKDTQADEPDSGAVLRITAPKELVGVGNGRLIESKDLGSKQQFIWRVISPINNYNITPYIGNYVNFKNNYQGETGNLEMSYWVLDYNLEKAKTHFKDAEKMMQAFEHWFGPYPFFADSYKLVDAPFLGMEHQSNIAYGNRYQNGYLGRDLSESGWGLKWDFIIVHESGHEWFGNSITSADIADMWVHESFTHYSETLFTEYFWGRQAGTDYITGVRQNILNDKPVIGPFGVNAEGSSDMYYKGGNMLHTIRTLMNDDEKFRTMLRDLNRNFYHKIVTGKEICDFMQTYCEVDLKPLYEQYLHSTSIPTLEYMINGKKLKYRYVNTVEGFRMPLRVSGLKSNTLIPGRKWQTVKLKKRKIKPGFDVNYFVEYKQVF